jgi:predicted anti-sigma-YlaC factor YlaD
VIITDCEKINDLLTDYINRKLPENENNIVISHLAVCKQCRAEAAMLLKIKALSEAVIKEAPSEIIYSAFEKIPHDETTLYDILNSGSVFMAFDIIRYTISTANKTIKLACQVL